MKRESNRHPQKEKYRGTQSRFREIPMDGEERREGCMNAGTGRNTEGGRKGGTEEDGQGVRERRRKGGRWKEGQRGGRDRDRKEKRGGKGGMEKKVPVLGPEADCLPTCEGMKCPPLRSLPPLHHSKIQERHWMSPSSSPGCSCERKEKTRRYPCVGPDGPCPCMQMTEAHPLSHPHSMNPATLQGYLWHDWNPYS